MSNTDFDQSYEARSERLTHSIWHEWARYEVDEDLRDDMLKSVQDIVNNTYIEGIEDDAWRALVLIEIFAGEDE